MNDPGVQVDLFCFFPPRFEPTSCGGGCKGAFVGTYSALAFNNANSAAEIRRKWEENIYQPQDVATEQEWEINTDLYLYDSGNR